MASRKSRKPRKKSAAESKGPTLTTVPVESGPVVFQGGTYEGQVRKTLIDLGAPDPDALLAASGGFWQKCQAAGVDAKTCGVTIYGSERHRHEVSRTTIHEAKEAPTREEWEVTVRRGHASIDKVAAVAGGRHPDAVEGSNAIYGEFYDDEKAQRFARRMTNAGFVSFYGPRRAMAAELAPVVAEGDASAMEAAPVVAEGLDPEVELRILLAPRGECKLIGPETGRAKQNGIAKYVAPHGSWRYVEYVDGQAVAALQVVQREEMPAAIANVYVLPEYRRQGRAARLLKRARKDFGTVKHSTLLSPAGAAWAKKVGEPVDEATEVAPVVAEVTWRKIERNPAQHEADLKLSEKYGAIKTPLDVYRVCGEAFSKEDSEVFVVLPLNLRGELKCMPVETARGQRSRVSVGVEDVMRAVVISGCEGFIVAHQHPSGKCTPSKADRELTEQIRKATAPFGNGVKFLDHVVIGTNQCFSICENKMYRVKKNAAP